MGAAYKAVRRKAIGPWAYGAWAGAAAALAVLATLEAQARSGASATDLLWVGALIGAVGLIVDRLARRWRP